MNMMVPNPVPAPAPLKTLSDTGLSMVMMRDVLLKTMFRKSCETARDIAAAVCMPVPLAQELVDIIRKAGLVEATGTLHAGKGGDMGFQLTEAGRPVRSMPYRSPSTMARCPSRLRFTSNKPASNPCAMSRSPVTHCCGLWGI